MDNRRSKENYYLDIAEAALERSTCLRRQFGAIIVRDDEIVAHRLQRRPARTAQLFRSRPLHPAAS